MSHFILSRFAVWRLLLGLCSVFASTGLCASTTTYIWTNQFPGHLAGTGDMNQSTNWSPNGVPNPMNGPDPDGTCGDLALFDGRTTGPLSVTESGGILAGFGGLGFPYGARIGLTSNQTDSVTIYSPVSVSGGLRMSWVTVDAGAGALNIGNNNTTNVLDIVVGEINGQVFGFTNNSATPSVVNPDVRWRMGGGGVHPFIFSGSGDWVVNNRMRTVASGAALMQKYGPGTMTWTATNVGALPTDSLGNPITIGGGTMIWKSSDIVGGSFNNPNMVHNGILFKYDAPLGVCTYAGNISGAGPIEISAGALLLLGQNTIVGNWTLTGGELIAGSIESVGVAGPLGQGGIILFSGGTLGWSLANAFDYSSRFDTAPGQIYNLDTGGSSPTLATGLTSVGGSLNKTGGGTLILAGNNTYSGLTTVGAGGQLLIQGTKSGTGNIIVADGGALGVVENGSQVTPGNLTLGSVTGATLEFNNVTNKTTPTLFPNTLVTTGPVTFNINGGRFRLIGEVFPLIKWTSGSAPAVSLGFLAGASGHLTTNGNEIDLVIDDPPYIWTDASANHIWNTSSVNWKYGGSDVAWVNGHFAVFDDTAGGTGAVSLSGSIAPTNATIDNSAITFSIASSGSGKITGGGSLTKNGNGTLTLPGGANDYTGVTTIGGGTMGVSVLANGGVASDMGAASSVASNIVLNGGTLQYTGSGISIDRLLSIGPNGGTIDNESGSGALVFTNTGSLVMSGSGPRTLTLSGPNNFGDTITPNIVNHPAGTGLNKIGAGTWILTGTNTYASGTTLLEGTLQIGAGGQSGTIGSGNISTAAGTGIDFVRAGTLLVSGSIGGSAGVTNDGPGTVILANNNSYTGGTFINAGTLQVGNGTSSGSLAQSGAIFNNSLLVFNTSGSFTYGSGSAGVISGSGNVIVQGGGFIRAVGNNTYLGWTRIDANTIFQPFQGQDGGLASPVVTNNGTLRLGTQNSFVYPGRITGSGQLQVLADAIAGTVTLTGTNSYTGGTFIGAMTLALGDGITPGAGAIAGNVQFVDNFQDAPRTLVFNRPDDFTFSGTITTNFTSPQINRGIVRQDGTGTVTLTGKNTYASGTVINAGTVQVGNGGTNGSVGSGPVTDNSILVFNRSDDVTFSSVISGTGAVVKLGVGRLLLNASNTYAGLTTVSNGTLGGNGVLSGPVSLEPGTTLEPGASVGTLTINNDLTLGGNMAIEINKSLAQSNDLVVITGTPLKTGTGTLTVSNLGPALRVGDKFTLFSQPLQNGAALNVSGAGATWGNNLAVDGSINVVSITRPKLNYTILGGGLQFSWDTGLGTFKLQSQTNDLNVGLSTAWSDYPGGNTSPITASIDTNETVFFRLVSP